MANWFDDGENESKNNPIETKHNPMNLTKVFGPTPAQISFRQPQRG
jgi:hypothetical protein